MREDFYVLVYAQLLHTYLTRSSRYFCCNSTFFVPHRSHVPCIGHNSTINYTSIRSIVSPFNTDYIIILKEDYAIPLIQKGLFAFYDIVGV